MPRLLIVFEYDTLNGGEHSLLAVLPLLRSSGWDIAAVWPGSRAGGADDDSANTLGHCLQKLGIESIALPTHDAEGYRLSQQQYRSRFADLLLDQRPDLVLCNSLSISRLCGPVTARLNVRSIGYVRDIIKLSKKAVSDINCLDRIIAVSHATKKFHVSHGVEETKICVIHNGVDLEKFHPRLRQTEQVQALRGELGIGPKSKIVLFVGQIGMRKGVDVLLDAFGRIATDMDDVHLLIVGQRHSQKQEAVEYENALIASSQQPTCAGRVHWLGRRDDVAMLMAASDLLLHPARQEPLGRVILESVVSGLPVVTTLVGGSPEILGCVDLFDLLCHVDDAQAMADRAKKILNQSVLWTQISMELSETGRRRFDRQRCFEELDAVLQKVRP